MKSKIVILQFFLIWCNSLYAWENRITHPALTDEAIGTSSIDNHLKTQLGLDNGILAELYWDFPTDIKERINGGDADPDETTRSILEWIRTGSTIEDEDGYWRLFNF